MRLAVVSDIHANLAALEAVLDHIGPRRPDCIVIPGDLVNRGPQPAEVIARLRPLNLPCVLGNHDRYVLSANVAGVPPELGEAWAPAAWTKSQLTADQLDYLAGLPFSLTIEDLLIVHASPRGDTDGIFRKTSDTELREKLAGYSRVVCGHTHVSLIRALDGRLVVNAGSAGNTFEGDTDARYAWLERHHDGWHASIHVVSYDVEATLRAFDHSDYLDVAGPLARLFRLEIATGRNHHISAYLAYRDLIENRAMTLAQAVDCYLRSAT